MSLLRYAAVGQAKTFELGAAFTIVAAAAGATVNAPTAKRSAMTNRIGVARHVRR